MLAIANAARKQRWHEKLGAGVACVISNKPDAEGLLAATALGIATHVVDHKQFESRVAFDVALQKTIDSYQPAIVVLAGFMRILTAEFVAHYAGRLVNIHPSLLPAFTGLNTHQRAIDAGCKLAGTTVHRVTADLDHGEILAQAAVPILESDSPVTLAARVLTQEHLVYPKAIRCLLESVSN